jgi:hypothetical protein
MNLQPDRDKGQRLNLPSACEGLELAVALLSTQKQLVACASADKHTAGLSPESMRMAIQRYKRNFFPDSLMERLRSFIEKSDSQELRQQLKNEFRWLNHNLEFPFKTGGEEIKFIRRKTHRTSSPISLEAWGRELGQACVGIAEVLTRSALKCTQQPAGLEALSAPQSSLGRSLSTGMFEETP